MKIRFPRTIAVAVLLGLLSAGWMLAKPQANPPIVLSYQDAPLFLGPHEHWVTAITFSPDGKTIVTGADGCIRFWDAASGRLRSIFGNDETRGVNDLAFTPDGSRLAFVGGLYDGQVVLWDTAAGAILQQFDDQTEATAGHDPLPFLYKGKPFDLRALNAVAYSPDGAVMASARDGVVLRDTRTGKILARLKQPARGVKALAFSLDGKTLATASEDRKVRLWSVPEGTLQATLDGPTQPLAAVAISPDGQQIVAIGSGNRSLLDSTPVGCLWSWQRAGGKARKTDLGNVRVHGVEFVGPASVVVGAGKDVLIINLAAEETARTRKFWSHSMDVRAVAVSPDGRFVASGGEDRTVDVVELATEKLVHRLPGLMDSIGAVAASADGMRFATATIDNRFSSHLPAEQSSFATRYQADFGGAGGAGRLQPSEVRLWSATVGKLLSLLPIPPSQVTAIAFVPHSSNLVVAGWIPEKGGLLSLWDTEAGSRLRDFAVQTAEVLSIAVSSDGRMLASGDAEGNMDLWEVANGAKIRSQKHDSAVESVAFSADGKQLATADANRTVRLYDAATGQLARTLKSREYVEALAFSPDMTRLAAGTRAPGLELWDLQAGTESRTLKAPGDYLATAAGFVAFSPDGRFVVCIGHGKDIAVFDVKSGDLHGELSGHAHPALSVGFLPDGRLLSGGTERTIRLWDPGKKKLLATWVAMPADPQQGWTDQWVGYTPAGTFVSSNPFDRLLGWKTGGDLIGPVDAARRRHVDNLFSATPAADAAKE